MNKNQLISNNLENEVNQIVNVDMFKIAKNNDTNRFEFVFYQEILDKIDLLIKTVNNYEYKDEDRKFIKGLKSYVNNFVKDLNTNIKNQQEELFSQITKQHRDFKDRFEKLVNLLNQGVAEQDAKTKAMKKEFCEKLFKDTLIHYEHLTNFNIKFEDIFIPQWTNLSTTESSIKKELNARLTNLDEFLASDLSPIKESDRIIFAFKMNDFNGIKALNFLQKQYDDELARKLLEDEKKKQAEERLSEKNEIESKILEKKYIALEIESNDFDKAVEVLARNNIDFRLI